MINLLQVHHKGFSMIAVAGAKRPATSQQRCRITGLFQSLRLCTLLHLLQPG
jgi:hypothetical protein